MGGSAVEQAQCYELHPGAHPLELFVCKSCGCSMKRLAGERFSWQAGYSGNTGVARFEGGKGVIVTTTRLADNTVQQQLPGVSEPPGIYMASNYHVSCRNMNRPGYCYLSGFAFGSALNAYMYREVFALRLDGSGTVERYSQDFKAPLPLADLAYSRQAQAVPNRNGSLVLFASDWNDPTSNALIYDYVAGVIGSDAGAADAGAADAGAADAGAADAGAADAGAADAGAADAGAADAGTNSGGEPTVGSCSCNSADGSVALLWGLTLWVTRRQLRRPVPSS